MAQTGNHKGLMFGIFIILAPILANRLGAPGIGLANAIAFTGEAVFLLALLSRQFRGVFNLGSASIRVLGGTLIAGAAAYAVITGLFMPQFVPAEAGLLPNLLLSAAAGLLGVIAVLPFIWPIAESRASSSHSAWASFSRLSRRPRDTTRSARIDSLNRAMPDAISP